MAQQKRPPPPPAPKGQTYFLLAMMVMMLIMINPELRDGMGIGMSYVLNPAIGFGGALPIVSILLAGVLTGLISTGLRHWATDFVEVERSRLLQRSFTRQLNRARLKRDEEEIHRLRRAQPHVMAKSMEANMSSMKPAMGTMILAIAVFWWLNIFVYQEVPFDCVSLPWTSCWPLRASWGLPYWVVLYSIMSLPITLAFGAALRMWRYRSFDPTDMAAPLPSIEEIVANANRPDADEVVIEKEAERARRRIRGEAAGEGPPEGIIEEEEGTIVEPPEGARVVQGEAAPGPRVVEGDEKAGAPGDAGEE